MAAANEDLPTGADAIDVEEQIKNFMALYGTFSDLPDENIRIFAKNVDKYKLANLIPELEMGVITIGCLKGEPRLKAKRWIDVPGETHPNADHWSPQVATRFQPEVVQDHCLRTYLINTYPKRIDLAEADQYLTTFKKQKPKQTCASYLDNLVLAFEKYSTMRWTHDELDANAAVRIDELFCYAKDGLCEEFRLHLDYQAGITTFDQLDMEIIRWQRDTVIGREFTKSCVPCSDPFENKNGYF